MSNTPILPHTPVHQCTDQESLAESTDHEQWRSIPKWTGYQASSEGRIRSIDRITPTNQFVRGVVRKLQPAKGQYLTVGLSIDGRNRTQRVARLVALAWIPVPDGFSPDDLEVAHINRNPADNRVCNLQWRTRFQNRPLGEDSGCARLTSKSVRACRRLAKAGASIAALATAFGVSVSTIRDAVRGITWKHLDDVSDHNDSGGKWPPTNASLADWLGQIAGGRQYTIRDFSIITGAAQSTLRSIIGRSKMPESAAPDAPSMSDVPCHTWTSRAARAFLKFVAQRANVRDAFDQPMLTAQQAAKRIGVTYNAFKQGVYRGTYPKAAVPGRGPLPGLWDKNRIDELMRGS